MINFETLFQSIIATLAITSLINLFFAQKNIVAKKLALAGNIFSLLITLFFTIYVARNSEFLISSCVILLILCAYLLAIIFTPLHHSTHRNYGLIGLMNVATIMVFCANNILIFFAAIIFGLLVIFFAMKKNRDTKKIFTLYIFGTISVITFTELFFPQSLKLIIFYAALIPLLGLFPFQSWYISLFERAPFGVIAALISFQGIVVFSAAQFLKLEEFFTPQLLLSIAILVSSFLAIIQQETRKLLAYLISSQLGFLLFAIMSNSSAINFGSAFMTLSFLGSSVGFVMMISALEMRKSDISLLRPSGCYASYPKLAFYLLIFGLISSGLPLSISYVAEDLIFERNFEIDPIADLACLIAIAINTISIIKIFLFLCQGTAEKENGIDLKKSEIFAAAFVLMAVFFTTLLST